MAALLAALLALLAAARPACAQQGVEWRSGIEAVTDVPFGLGGRIWGEGPLGIRLEVGLSFVPRAYVDVVDGFRVATGGYSRAMGEAMGAAAQVGYGGSVHLAWRPLPRAGLIVAFGYRFVGLVGPAVDQSLLALGSGQPAPQSEAANAQYLVQSNLHLLEGEIGWQWLLLDDRLTLRAALGMAGAVGSSTRLAPGFQVSSSPAVDQFEAAAAAAYGTAFSRFYCPYLSFAVGYNFGGAGLRQAPAALPATAIPLGPND
jgi:hypothetical protein